MLPRMDVAGRLTALRRLLPDAGCDALLVTRLVHLRYLTGFTGSAGMLLVLPDDAVLVTDGRYRDQSADQLAASGVDAGIEVRTTVAEQLAVLASAAAGVRRLGLEAATVTWAQQRSFAADAFRDHELVATEGVVEELRLVKDAGEIARIAAASAIADSALAEVVARFHDGPTEREVALDLEVAMRRLGADGPSFETIVASGPNAAKPHARPTARRLVGGDLVIVDFGALVEGYHSDMTRTFVLGDPTPEQQRMLDVVTASQAAGVAAVRSGTTGQAVDRVCRDVIAEAGWGDAFLHGTGHGVGLEIHEGPKVAQTAAASLAPGHVVTVEPGVYLPGAGGVRVEDTVVVTPDGCQALTLAPKDPILR